MMGDAGKGTSTKPEDCLSTDADPADIDAMLAVIPSDNYWPWFEVGCAIYHELGPGGFERFERWSKRTRRDNYDAAGCAAKYNEECSKFTRFTIATMCHYADKADPGWRARLQQARTTSAAPRLIYPGATTKAEPTTEKSSVIVQASQVRMRAKHWLWRGHLLRGAQELLTGIPGVGKSQVQCCYISCTTSGLVWPNGDPGTSPSNVIMITAEDTVDQEVIPRLVAAGADCNRVYIMKSIKIDEKTSRQFLLAEDLDQLARDIARIGDVSLVTMDPITAYMGGKIDSHKTTEVRSQLGPLKDFAETYDVAVSTITHPAKNAGQRAIDHFIGSQAFIAAGRIGHVCVEEMREDENEEKMVPTGRILFAHAKHNPSVKMPTLAYRVSALVVGQDEASGEIIDAPHVVWEKDPVDITADEAVGISKKKNSAQTKVQGFLKKMLAGGNPVAQKYIVEEGKQRHGFTEKQVRTAKENLGIVSDKELDGWTWTLPQGRARS
jgi:hypothetical protein